MDIVCEIVDKIINDNAFKECKKFTGNFLNNVGNVFVKYGFCSAKLFVEGKNDDKDKWQSNALIRVLEILQEYDEIKRNRGLGTLIIKTLPSLKEKKNDYSKNL